MTQGLFAALISFPHPIWNYLTDVFVFLILAASSGIVLPCSEREGLQVPEQRKTERDKKSGRNGAPAPQSRVTLSASTRKIVLLTGSSAEFVVGCSGVAAVPFL